MFHHFDMSSYRFLNWLHCILNSKWQLNSYDIVSLLISQLMPEYPDEQVHVYVLLAVILLHVPLFKQGSEAQGSVWSMNKIFFYMLYLF